MPRIEGKGIQISENRRNLCLEFRALEAMVGVAGLEPATFCTPCRRASQATLHPEP